MKKELAEWGKAGTDKMCWGLEVRGIPYKFVLTTRPSIFQKDLLPSSC